MGRAINEIVPTTSPILFHIGLTYFSYPTKNYTKGSVISEYPRQGYVNDLLAQGTLTLKTDGAVSVRADTDINNTPIVSAFERAGYKQFASRREYRLMQVFINS